MRAIVGEAGWITAAELQREVSARTVGNRVSSGALVLLRPGVYALPTAAQSWRIRLASALAWGDGVASHVTALALWGLVEHPAGPVHVTRDLGKSARGSSGVAVHRSRGIDAERRRVPAFPVTSVERSLVDAWARPAPLTRADVRAAAIPPAARASWRSGAASPCCMPPFVQQRRIVVDGETFLLDTAYDEVQLAVELDGAAWHGSQQQRERDIRRDALLATAGWQTLRSGFRRLTTAPEACRRDIRSVCTARRALFEAGGDQWT